MTPGHSVRAAAPGDTGPSIANCAAHVAALIRPELGSERDFKEAALFATAARLHNALAVVRELRSEGDVVGAYLRNAFLGKQLHFTARSPFAACASVHFLSNSMKARLKSARGTEVLLTVQVVPARSRHPATQAIAVL